MTTMKNDIHALPADDATGFVAGIVAGGEVEAGLFDGRPSRSMTLPRFSSVAGANPPDGDSESHNAPRNK